MLTRAEIFDKLAEWRPGASLDWLTSTALAVGRFTDGAGNYHPEFVLNFGHRPGHGSDFSDLHFGTKFYFNPLPHVEWVNEQNRQLRFTRLVLEADSVRLTADLYGPDEALQMITFEGTFVLYDHALVLIRAMAAN